MSSCENDPIEITKGSDMRLRFEWLDEADNPIDGTGAVATAFLKTSNVEIDLVVSWHDRTLGLFDVKIGRNASAQMTDGATNKIIVNTETPSPDPELTIWPPLIMKANKGD